MKLTISITGQVDEKNLNDVRGAIDKLLSTQFDSFTFRWEVAKGMEK